MKISSLKVAVLISIFLNVLLLVLLFNSSIENHKYYSTGDPTAYRIFINGLDQYEHYLEDASQQSTSNEVMNSLINGNERLKRSINSFTIFKNSLNETNFNTQYIEVALTEIDEATFHLMANYSLNSSQVVEEEIDQLKRSVNSLLKSLPKEYNVDYKKEFIETINALSGSN